MSTEASIAGVANKVTYGASGIAFWGGWTANEWAAYGGLAVAVMGLIVQIAFKVRADMRESAADRRERDEHAERMSLLKRGIDPHGD